MIQWSLIDRVWVKRKPHTQEYKEVPSAYADHIFVTVDADHGGYDNVQRTYYLVGIARSTVSLIPWMGRWVGHREPTYVGGPKRGIFVLEQRVALLGRRYKQRVLELL